MRPLIAFVAAFLALLVTATAARAAELPRLEAVGGERPAIADARGREVLLRGINVNQLGDYYAADPAKPTTFPLEAADFAGMRRLGFNVVRLVINWSAIEPRRGAFDPAYVERIRAAVAQAKAEGLYTVLDMHQDAWGKFIATRPGEPCPPGAAPAIGWDGAPEWATFADGQSTCRFGDTRELSPAVARAFDNFYADREGIQSALAATWGRLAQAFAGEPAIAGYDLFNEPHPGLPRASTRARRSGATTQPRSAPSGPARGLLPAATRTRSSSSRASCGRAPGATPFRPPASRTIRRSSSRRTSTPSR